MKRGVLEKKDRVDETSINYDQVMRIFVEDLRISIRYIANSINGLFRVTDSATMKYILNKISL